MQILLVHFYTMLVLIYESHISALNHVFSIEQEILHSFHVIGASMSCSTAMKHRAHHGGIVKTYNSNSTKLSSNESQQPKLIQTRTVFLQIKD